MDDSETMQPWICDRRGAKLRQPGGRDFIRDDGNPKTLRGTHAEALLELVDAFNQRQQMFGLVRQQLEMGRFEPHNANIIRCS